MAERDDARLPRPPHVRLDVLEDRTPRARCDEGFLRLRRLSLRNRYPDGRQSAPYDYDVVERSAMDAVVLVLESTGSGGPEVCLRSCLRPPLAFRGEYALPLPDEGETTLWEVPAGLVEAAEQGEQGLRRCAARETFEEVGLRVPPEAFEALGPPTYLSPGVLGEKLHFFIARVDPRGRETPPEDGTPVEEGASIRFLALDVALQELRGGAIADLKTEIAIRRLAEARELR